MASRKPKENHELNALMLDIAHLEKPRSKPSDEPELEIGTRLAKLRERELWSQEQLSQATKEHDSTGAGISRAVISMYERGRNRPGMRELRILCDTLRVTPSELLYGSPTPFEIDKWQILNSNHSHPLYFARWLHLFTQLPTNVQLSIYELVIEFIRPTQAQVDRLDYLASRTLLRLADRLRADFTEPDPVRDARPEVEVLESIPATPPGGETASQPGDADPRAPARPRRKRS